MRDKAFTLHPAWITDATLARLISQREQPFHLKLIFKKGLTAPFCQENLLWRKNLVARSA